MAHLKKSFRRAFPFLLVWSIVTVTPGFGQFTPKPSPEVVQVIYRSNSCFTQGFFYEKGLFWESCGLRGESALQISNERGELLQKKPVADHFFAEGLTRGREGALIQLTWQSQKVLIWDAAGQSNQVINYPLKEGWGIAYKGRDYLVSDGSSSIWTFDGKLSKKSKFTLLDQKGNPLDQINELEWTGSYLLANVWQTQKIVVIDVEKKQVVETWNMSSLWKYFSPAQKSKIDVLNGIAWDKDSKRLWVTGKWWPAIFEVYLPGSVIYQ